MAVRLLSEIVGCQSTPSSHRSSNHLDVTSTNFAFSFRGAKSDLPLGADLLTTMMRFGAEAIFDALAKVASERVQSC